MQKNLLILIKRKELKVWKIGKRCTVKDYFSSAVIHNCTAIRPLRASSVIRSNNQCHYGLISKYLPWYDERHTFISHACRNGVDPQTVGKMVGNSADMIIKHYWAANNNLSNLPDIF